MKAQILKIAGVKNEKEFYKKFPTEEAFMKKHGKELKKAQVGAMIGGQTQPKAFTPLAYNDLENQSSAAFQGITPEELTRRKAVEDAKAVAGAGGNQGGGIMDSIGKLAGSLDPEMISSLVGGARNGKKLKKAQTGTVMGSPFQGMPKTPNKFSLPATGGFDTSVANNPNLSGSLIGGQKAQASSGSWAANPYLDSPFKAKATATDPGFDWQGLAGKVAPALGGLIGDFTKLQEQNKSIKKQQMYGKVSDKVLEASGTRAEQAQRRYVRPEDQAVQNLNPLGKGTNYLAARNGTEIQNTYNPGDIYSDLGYAPLVNQDQVKQYKKGGKMKKAMGGVNLDPFAGIAGSLGGALGSKITGGSGKGGPGSSIGSTIGGIAGSFIPIPGLGTALGALAGGTIGGLFDGGQQKEEELAQNKINDNLFKSSFQSGAQGVFAQNDAVVRDGGNIPSYEDGGYVSNDWTPQVITTFGEHKLKDLLQPPHDADMLRAGGHLRYYTPPSAEAMYTGRRMDEGGVMRSTNMMFDTDRNPRAENGVQMAMGGDLQVERGEAETMSHNPYLPDAGETIMFRGPSHENGGMPVSFGNNGVEVEGGEPAIKMRDGGNSDNLVVYGNMVIPEYGANEIEDPKAKGKKFKHYVADLSKQEAKINKSIEKGVELVNTKDSDDPYDQLAFNSGKAMMMGGNLKLKTIAKRKLDAAAVQNAILDTAEEFGIKSDELAKGKLKMDKDNNMYAEFGKKVKFQTGGKTGSPTELWQIPKTERAQIAKANGIKNYTGTKAQNEKLISILNESASAPGKPAALKPGDFDIRNYIPGGRPLFYTDVPYALSIGKFDPEMGMYVAPELEEVKVTEKKLKNEPASSLQTYKPLMGSLDTKEKSDKPSWWDAATMAMLSASPFLRPSSDRPIDPAQLAPEMMSLATNTLEPVPAQGFNPLLAQTTSISLQDQLNEVTAQARAAEKMSAYNPEAAAMIAAGAYDARNKILGEQFRLNQAEQQRVAEQNRNVLNDAMLKNLAIYDQQFERQAKAKSNTREQAIEAMKSVADKIAKNKLENRTLAAYENLYPAFSFTESGTAYKNPLYTAAFNALGGGKGRGAVPEGFEAKYKQDDAGNFIIDGFEKKKKDTARNGSIVKAIKDL